MASIEKSTLRLFIAFAVFAIGGYVVYVGLGRFLLTPEQFGIYSVIIALIGTIEVLMVFSIKQAVSKYISETPSKADIIKIKALKFQLITGLFLFIAIYLLAPFIALLLNDSKLTFFIQLVSPLLLFRSTFSVMDGYLNGTKQFIKQSWLTILLTITKTILILGLAFIGFGLIGALAGFTIAMLVASLIALAMAGIKKIDKEQAKQFKTINLLKFGLPIAVFYLLINLLGSFDLFAIKALTPINSSDLFSGYYSVAVSISRIPWLLINAILFIIFPLVSSTTSHNDIERTRFYIKNAIRYSLLFVTPIVVLISAMSPRLIDLIFSSIYSPASFALSILAFGIGFFCLFLVLNTIIQGSNKPNIAVKIALITLVIDIGLNFALVPSLSLVGGAIATTVSLFIGMIIAGLYVFFRYKTLVEIKSLLRISFAGIILFAIAWFFPFTGLLLVAQGIFLIGLYIAILFAIKELKQKDFNVLTKMVK
jgi:O-antigen/teichoic acid export membrane protein